MLKRRTPLKRTGGLKRTPMKRVNKERKAKRDAEAFGPQAEFCRMMPCAACGGWGLDTYRKYAKRQAEWTFGLAFTRVSDPQHCPTRGAGGKDKDTLPLCREHHMEAGRIGELSFNAKYGIDQRAIARAIHEELSSSGTQEE